MPPRLVPVQTFTVTMMHFFGNSYKHVSSLEKVRHILRSQLSDKLRGPFYTMDVETFLVRYKLIQGVILKKSTITHRDARLDLFSARIIGKGEAVWYQ